MGHLLSETSVKLKATTPRNKCPSEAKINRDCDAHRTASDFSDHLHRNFILLHKVCPGQRFDTR